MKKRKNGILKSIILTIPMVLLLALVIMGNADEAKTILELLTMGISWVLFSVLFFLTILTGKTYKYRKLLYILMAFCFILTFITNLIEIRGSNTLTKENIIQGETPFCHLVIPMIIIPAALTRTIIFPGSLVSGFASITSMIVLWLAASLVLGRGWCSWVCFYGGLDEGFSCLCKKTGKRSIDKKWTYLPYAILLFIVLVSAYTLSPTYCEWLCPFKAVTEFEAVTSFKILVQTIIFVSLFILLVIALPILTGKRTQCALFCPFAAFQPWMNKISIFDIRIDREKCVGCKKCIQMCPTLSMDDKTLAMGKTLLSCTKCGRCIDICPKEAVHFHIKGTGLSVKYETARVLFLYPAFLMLATLGSGMVTGAMFRIIKLITTGSLF